MACRFKESIRAYGSRDELHIIMKFEYQIGFVNVPLAFKLQCTVCIKLMLAFYFPTWNAFHESNYLIFSSLTMCKKYLRILFATKKFLIAYIDIHKLKFKACRDTIWCEVLAVA